MFLDKLSIKQTVLFGLFIFCIFFEGVEASNKWTTNPRFIEQAIKNQADKNEINTPISPQTKAAFPPAIAANQSRCDSPFHGWWKATSFGDLRGFNGFNDIFQIGSRPVIADQYIFIDTSVFPVQVLTTYGTAKFPRTQDPLDRPPPILPPLPGNPQPFSCFFQTPRELVNFYNAPLSGPVNPFLTFSEGPTLKLQDKETLVAYSFSNPKYTNGLNRGPIVYKKICHNPEDTLNDNWNDPVLLFQYYADLMTFQNPSTNKESGATNYVGKKKAKKIMRQFLGEGFTVKTPIRKIRITNFTNYDAMGLIQDVWTTIYTGDPCTNEGIFSNVNPGASVTISGATGPLSILNGFYYNGVSVLNCGANDTLKRQYVDRGPNGSFNDLFNSFLLNLDTTDLASLADPLTGFIDIPPGVSVEVTYQVNGGTEYPEFCAACAAYFYAVVRAATHNFRLPFTHQGSSRIVNTFADLQAGLLDGSVVQNYIDYGGRLGQPRTNGYYHNWVDIFGYLGGEMVNCPYPLNFFNPILEYDVALGNYLVDVHNLYFGIQGTLEADQLDPQSFGYPAVIPAEGRAHFVGKIAPAIIENGLNFATPPPGYATMGDYGFDFGNLNAYYFGEINPQLTNGKTIGYLFMVDCGFIDPFELATFGTYAPENPNTSNNPRIGRESVCTIYSEMMKWFNAAPPYDFDENGNPRNPCEKIIIDFAGNFGGDPTLLQTISEFMGSDRIVYKPYIVPKKSRSKLISYNNSSYPTVNEAAADQKCTYDFLYVNMNREKYPGSVFEGTKENPKELIFLTDISSFSAADLSPNLFTGDHDDGYLGDHVQMNLVGCVDGREFGFYDPGEFFPVNDNTRLRLPDGTPVSPFTIFRDDGSFFFEYGKSGVSPYIQHRGIRPVRTPVSGTDGGAALPISFEETLFQDLGLTPMTRAPLPGWAAPPPSFEDQSTWRFLYLEQAIELAKGPVKFRTKHSRKIKNKLPVCFEKCSCR